MVSRIRDMLALSTLSISREGDVQWRVMGDHHCGPKAMLREGRMPVRYSMTVTCAPALDDRGFLFDQAMVDLWVRRLADIPTALSCEALVIDVARRFMTKVERDVPHCRLVGLRMTLSPAPHSASVTARYGATTD